MYPIRLACLLLTLILTVLVASPSLAQQASFQWLGHLNPDQPLTSATAVSADGSVVVGSSMSLIPTCYDTDNDGEDDFCEYWHEAYRWTEETGMVALGDLVGGRYWSTALGVSGDGQVVVGYADTFYGEDPEDADSYTQAAFKWVAGDGMTQLSSLGDGETDDGTTFRPFSYAWAATTDGSIIVGYNNVSNRTENVLWTTDGVQVLGGGQGRDISADGQVVVGFVSFAEMWTADEGFVDIPGMKGALGVSSNGRVVIGRGEDGRVVRWSEGTGPIALDMLFAQGINADGSVIVGYDYPDGDQHAMIWTSSAGTQRLQDVLLDQHGIDLGAWRLGSAEDVSDDGTVIVGYAQPTDGTEETSRAFRLVLPPFCEGSDGAGKATDTTCGCIEWTSTGGGDFDDEENWESGLPPGNGTCVRFDIQATYTVDLTEDAETGMLSVGSDLVTLDLNGHTYTVSTSLDDDGTGTPFPAVEVAAAGESGTLILREGTLVVENSFVRVGAEGGLGKLVISEAGRIEGPTGSGVWFELGNGAGAEGGLLIEAGGLLNTPFVKLLALDETAAAVIEVKDTGSLWSGAQATLGEYGTAELIIREQGQVEMLGLTLAAYASSHADVLVHGEGSILRIKEAGTLTVGNEGQAVLWAEAGGAVVMDGQNQIFIAQDAGAVGEVTLTDGASWTGGGVLTVGEDGQGLVTIDGEASAQFGTVLIAAYAGEAVALPESRLTVDGAGTTLTLGIDDATTGIGAGGPGVLAVTDGAELVVSGNLMVGAAPVDPLAVAANSGGRFEARGAGTTVVIQGGLALGDQNQGDVLITDGAQVTTDVTRIGFFALADPPVNTLTVEDVGSTLVTPWLYVGADDVPGTLTIGPGASVLTSNLSIEAMGTVNGIVLAVGQPAAPKQGLHTEGGLFADTLYLAQGAVLNVDALILAPGGVLAGSAWPMALTNTATLSPGDSTGRVGTYRVTAAYTQAESGILAMEVGAEGHDVLSVEGTATLGGTLRLRYLDGYTPRSGDRFTIVTGEAVAGTFETVETPEGAVWTVHYEEASVTVEAASVVAVEDVLEAPEVFALHANYPNPFNPTTQIGYDVAAAGPVRLVVYDALGREVAVLVDRVQAAGRYQAAFAAGNLPSGLYLYRLTAGGTVQTRTMLLVR